MLCLLDPSKRSLLLPSCAVGAHDVDALAEAMAQGASLLPASATLQRAKTTMTSLA